MRSVHLVLKHWEPESPLFKVKEEAIHGKITWLVNDRKQDSLQLDKENRCEKKGRKIVSSSV